MYLQEIAINNDKAEWNFNWYSMEDLKSIDHYASRLGVQAYKKINIDEL